MNIRGNFAFFDVRNSTQLKKLLQLWPYLMVGKLIISTIYFVSKLKEVSNLATAIVMKGSSK